MNNGSRVRRIPVCPRCGSANVTADAAARWNVERQEFEVSNIFDKGHGCDDCGAEDIEFSWIDDPVQGARVSRPSPHSRALDDIEVREEETEAGVVVGGRIEWATFTEGEYIESILVDRARAAAIYRDLGKALNATREWENPMTVDAESERVEGYFVELREPGVWQSVFPAKDAELSQTHSSIEDARAYILEQAPSATVQVLPYTEEG